MILSIELADTPYPQLTIIGLLGICLLDRSEIVSRKLDKSQQLTKRSPVNVRYPFFLGLPNRGCCYQLVVFASVSACLVLCVCRLQAGLVPSLGRARADAGSAEPGRGGARAGEAPTPAQSRRGKPRPETWQICGTVLTVLICCVSCWLGCVYFSSVLTSDLKVFPYVLKSFWPIRYMIFATSAN